MIGVPWIINALLSCHISVFPKARAKFLLLPLELLPLLVMQEPKVFVALSLATWSSSRQRKVKLGVKSVVFLYLCCHQGSVTGMDITKKGWK